MPMNLWMQYSRQAKKRFMYNLNAFAFQYKNEPYELEFQKILTGITACYKMMIKDNVSVPSNDEDRIRDILYYKYFNNDKVKNNSKLRYFIFDCEVAEYDTTGNLAGYLDFKISTQNRFIESSAYYSIECKRLDNQNITGTSGLNAEYIKEGIMRFVINKYSTYYGINGMIGFVVERIDIDGNITNINMLLKNHFYNSNTDISLTKTDFIENFSFQYYSMHRDNNDKNLKLYHLMFDFSSNIQGIGLKLPFRP